MKNQEIKVTNNFELFESNYINRKVLDEKGKPKNRKLLASMREHGFFPHAQIVVTENKSNGKLTIQEGHNRFSVAKYLNLPLYYQIVPEYVLDPRFDQDAFRPWSTDDVVSSEIDRGNKSYLILEEMMSDYPWVTRHKGTAGAILSNTYTSNAAGSAIKSAKFNATSEGIDLFLRVAISMNCPEVEHLDYLRHSKFLGVLCAAIDSGEFDAHRFREKLALNPDKMRKCGTRREYLTTINSLYNRSQPAHTVADLESGALRVVRARIGSASNSWWSK
jgi:hypothetical protein